MSGIIRGLFVLAIGAVLFGGYAYTQFRGLRDPAAMEYAQLARNSAGGRGLATQVIRPLDLWFLERHKRPGPGGAPVLPDLRHAPGYPLLLAQAFRIRKPSFAVPENGRALPAETQVVVPLGILLCLGTAAILFGLAHRLFGPVAGWVSLAAFVVSETALEGSISGTPLPLLMLLATATLGSAGLAVAIRRSGGRWLLWLPLMLLSALLAAASALSSYALLALVPAAVLLIGWSFGAGRSAVVLGLVAAVALLLAPWALRNQRVSGSPAGLTPFSALRDSALFPGDTLDRSAEWSVRPSQVTYAVRMRLAAEGRRVYDQPLRTLGSGLLICFFLVALFHKFEPPEVNAIKWAVGLALLLLLLAGAVFGGETAAALSALWPLVIVFGVGFFLALLEREEFFDAGWPTVVTWLLVLLTALPAGLRLAGPRAAVPYPPYFPPFAGYVSAFLDPGETLCTDIPWATAWYGNRSSLLLPNQVSDLERMRAAGLKLGGVYLTQRTGDKPYVSELLEGAEQSWLPLLNRRVPPDFPFQHGLALPPGTREQLFLTDRPRWSAPARE